MAIETMLNSAHPHPTEHPTMTAAWEVGRNAIAADPPAAFEELKKRERSMGAEEELRRWADQMDKHTRGTETGEHRVSVDCIAMRRRADEIKADREKETDHAA